MDMPKDPKERVALEAKLHREAGDDLTDLMSLMPPDARKVATKIYNRLHENTVMRSRLLFQNSVDEQWAARMASQVRPTENPDPYANRPVTKKKH